MNKLSASSIFIPAYVIISYQNLGESKKVQGPAQYVQQ